MDPEKRRRIALGALLLGVILLAWDVVYLVQGYLQGYEGGQLLALFGAGAIPAAALFLIGLALQRRRPVLP